MHPAFAVPGIDPKHIWQLFNVSNYFYYCLKVDDLIKGRCPFCDVDPNVNKILLETELWRLWKNDMAPRSGQEYQLITMPKRHIERQSEMTAHEWNDLRVMMELARTQLNAGDDGVWLVRTGDPARNARSVPHLHYNFQCPTGNDDVSVTIAKSPAKLAKKLPELQVWEKLRLAGYVHGGLVNPLTIITLRELEIVKDNMGPPITK